MVHPGKSPNLEINNRFQKEKKEKKRRLNTENIDKTA